MPSRRAVLGIIAGGAAASVPFIGSAFFSRADAADGLPITVTNNTGQFPNSAITMYIVGEQPNGGPRGYVKSPGRFTPAALSDNGADGYVDLGIPLSGDGDTSFILPKMVGSRIYFSINERLKFKVVTDGNGKPSLQFPVGWAEGDPNFGVLHDCCEFAFTDDGMFCNTTNVDMFSIPMSIRLRGGGGEKVAGAPAAGSRNQIFAEMRQQPGFERLVIGDNLRIVAPSHAIGIGRFSPTYLDGYIGEMWDRYATTDLRVRTLQGEFTGRVTDGRLSFSGAGGSFARPSTSDVLFCHGALQATNDGMSGPVAAIVAAGLNRSVLGDPNQPTTDPARFYQGPVTNHYSRIMHKYAGDGLAYGFAFDDVTEQASYTQDNAPQHVQVTLTPFGDGGGTVPEPGAPEVPVVVVPPVQEKKSHDAYGQIAADGHSAEHGTTRQGTSGGGGFIGNIANGDWACYAGVDFGDRTATQFTVRVASGAGPGISGLVEIRLDGPGNPVLGSVAVADTGGWETWRVVPGNLAAVTGTHDVYLTFTSGQPNEYVNVSWLQFAER
ncbi:beta-1,3-glucanase family protein [Actinoplanes sp. NPDC049599]|uniref:beta-1,3-glucanase family protein n=1 Tax=Actinoplanes sp. NPDC049599 TaxID=3363903 RepID=UPI0037BB4D81